MSVEGSIEEQHSTGMKWAGRIVLGGLTLGIGTLVVLSIFPTFRLSFEAVPVWARVAIPLLSAAFWIGLDYARRKKRPMLIGRLRAWWADPWKVQPWQEDRR